MNQRCVRCGAAVAGSARFCSGCGNDLSVAGSVTNLPLPTIQMPPAPLPTLKRLSSTSALTPADSPPPPSGTTLRRLADSPPAPTPPTFAFQSPAFPPPAGYYGASNPPLPPADYYGASNPAPPPGYYGAGNVPPAPPGYYASGAVNPPAPVPVGYYGAGVGMNPPRSARWLTTAGLVPIVIIGMVVALLVTAALHVGDLGSFFSGSRDCRYDGAGNRDLHGELAAAFSTMCQTNSFHVVMTGSLDGHKLSLNGDFKRGAGRYNATVDGQSYQAIILGNDAYVSQDGSKWIKDYTGQVKNVASLAALFDIIPANFSDKLEDLGSDAAAGNAHKIETHSGGPGTILGTGSSGYVIFWVADDGSSKSVHRLQLSGDLGAFSGSFDIAYSSFNLPVNVTAPPVSNANGFGDGFKSAAPTLKKP